MGRVAGIKRVVETRRPLQRPCVIVLDNYSVHHSKPVKELEETLNAAGVTFFYLPPYSPQLNHIEPLWKQIKHVDLTRRSYRSEDELKHAGHHALLRRAHLLPNSNNFLHATA